jgi:ubiquinone/menaquinone biosynthesis C-methylase UbiE
MNNINKSFEEITRKIFHELHIAQSEDPYIFNRLATLLNCDYFGFTSDFFHDKSCLDVGCGSNGNGSFNLLELGALHVTACDLDDSFIKPVKANLNKFSGKFTLQVEDVQKLSFDNSTFDFVHCAGVLHHSKSVKKGIEELCRVTKSEGYIYIETYGAGGIIRDFTSALRNKYSNDISFKNIVDNLSVKQIQTFIYWLLGEMNRNGDTLVQSDGIQNLIELLFDEDLILTIKDRIQAPVYTENTESELRDFLSRNGIINIRRLKRYPYLKNIRRFLSPIYNEYQNDIAHLLYGDGQVQLIGQKK